MLSKAIIRNNIFKKDTLQQGKYTHAKSKKGAMMSSADKFEKDTIMPD